MMQIIWLWLEETALMPDAPTMTCQNCDGAGQLYGPLHDQPSHAYGYSKCEQCDGFGIIGISKFRRLIRNIIHDPMDARWRAKVAATQKELERLRINQ